MIDISSEGEALEACAGVLQEVFGYASFFLLGLQQSGPHMAPRFR